jgi:hypothetical protein
LADPNYQPTTLKRTRPKTHWIWYLTAVSASLVMGVTVTYAMQYANPIAKHTVNNHQTIAVSHVNKAEYAHVPSKKIIVANEKPDVPTTTSKIKKPTPSSPTPTPTKQDIPVNETVNKTIPVAKQNTRTNHSHSEKSHAQTKPTQHVSIEVQTPTVQPSPSIPKPPPTKHNQTSIGTILDQVSTTVRDLLIGS